MNERELVYLEKIAKRYCKNGLENKFQELLKHEKLINNLLLYSRVIQITKRSKQSVNNQVLR